MERLVVMDFSDSSVSVYTNPEDKDTESLLKEYGHNIEVRAVPTLILVDDEGNVVKRHSGLLGVQELKEFCNEAN